MARRHLGNRLTAMRAQAPRRFFSIDCSVRGNCSTAIGTARPRSTRFLMTTRSSVGGCWKKKGVMAEALPLFWDDAAGGLFLSGAKNETLIARTKELYDGAIPSGNSVAALVLVRLSQLTMDEAMQDKAKRLIEAFSGEVARAPHAFPQFLIAVDGWLGPSQEIVIAGDPDAPATRRMLEHVHRRFLPRASVVLHPPGEAGRTIESLIPFVANQVQLNGQPTAYVCENYLCKLPTTDVAKLVELLDAIR